MSTTGRRVDEPPASVETVWTPAGVRDYRAALEETLAFPLRADGVVPLFVLGVLFNFISVVDDGTREMGAALVVPSLLLFGYLAHVGASVARGGAKPPAFRLSTEGLKRYLRDGLKLLVPFLSLLLGGTLLAAVVVVPLTFVLGEWVLDPAATIVAAPILLAFVLLAPGALVHAGFDRTIRGTYAGDVLRTFLDVVLTRAYLEALLAFVLLLTVARVIGAIAEFIPVVGVVIAAAALFYAQLSSMYVLGSVYGTIRDGRSRPASDRDAA